jgi:hypothetical protein
VITIIVCLDRGGGEHNRGKGLISFIWIFSFIFVEREEEFGEFVREGTTWFHLY